jgi:hypothetical protein
MLSSVVATECRVSTDARAPSGDDVEAVLVVRSTPCLAMISAIRSSVDFRTGVDGLDDAFFSLSFFFFFVLPLPVPTS